MRPTLVLAALALIVGCGVVSVGKRTEKLHASTLKLGIPPYRSEASQVLDVSHIRCAKGESLPWQDTKGVRFFVLPGDPIFNRFFRGYIWWKPGGGGFVVVDLENTVVLSCGYMPKRIGAIDLQADGDLDFVVCESGAVLAGTGWGTETPYLNCGGRYVEAPGVDTYSAPRTQENRVGAVTWFSHPTICAVFDGEELEVNGGEQGAMVVNRVAEEYVLDKSRIRLGRRSCVQIGKSKARYLPESSIGWRSEPTRAADAATRSEGRADGTE